jgi:hypothetical protein
MTVLLVALRCQAHPSWLTLLASLPGVAYLSLSLSGCARPVEAESGAQPASTERACPEVKGAAREGTEAPQVPWGYFAIGSDPRSCQEGQRGVSSGPSHTCLPRVTPDQLASSEFWSKPVLLEEVQWRRWDRGLNYKSKRDLDSALGIFTQHGPIIPVQYPIPRSLEPSYDVLCERGAPGGGCLRTIPSMEPGRAWIGIVRPHFTSGGLSPTLTFDLLAVEAPPE